MTGDASNNRTQLSTTLFYRDAPAAIDWLERVFGFQRHVVIPGPDGGIVHSELESEGQFVMVGSADHARGFYSPLDLPGVAHTVYLVFDDIDGHYQRAKAAGASIEREIEDTDYGARTYSARDLEGHFWSFGTYRLGPEGRLGSTDGSEG